MEESIKTELPCLELIKHYGKPALQLILPSGCDELDDVSCSDENDLEIPDLKVILYLPSLITALNVLHQYPNELHHVSANCWVDSDSYEGKIRLEFLNVYAHTFQGNWNHSFFLNFSNDWTGSTYFLDLGRYLHDFLDGYDDIVTKLERLAATEIA